MLDQGYCSYLYISLPGFTVYARNSWPFNLPDLDVVFFIRVLCDELITENLNTSFPPTLSGKAPSQRGEALALPDTAQFGFLAPKKHYAHLTDDFGLP
ncbi:hypothetical protein An15g05190 [Aspergillus niger]|uniref:Uncharacterized protein n=2 Tax=Aspergillus niger TaxID=5061 RepID=A2R5Q6_ASPNC|nr:hypothetical protein An15g05190 [Aspergillus niger]CAK42492.1 hypothetical protein An15g05190 [Aspergillus niger]